MSRTERETLIDLYKASFDEWGERKEDQFAQAEELRASLGIPFPHEVADILAERTGIPVLLNPPPWVFLSRLRDVTGADLKEVRALYQTLWDPSKHGGVAIDLGVGRNIWLHEGVEELAKARGRLREFLKEKEDAQGHD